MTSRKSDVWEWAWMWPVTIALAGLMAWGIWR